MRRDDGCKIVNTINNEKFKPIIMGDSLHLKQVGGQTPSKKFGVVSIKTVKTIYYFN